MNLQRPIMPTSTESYIQPSILPFVERRIPDPHAPARAEIAMIQAQAAEQRRISIERTDRFMRRVCVAAGVFLAVMLARVAWAWHLGLVQF